MEELEEGLVRVRSLSDDALLLGLAQSLRASRRAVADIVVHLGEVEERRLHLLGGYSSMFDYCVTRLGMSEDEAYRRLEVARLVRRYPELLDRLDAGQISLSVAALLKARLTDENHVALLAAVSGKTVAQAREVLAAWFPQPDVMPPLRKLPARVAPPAMGVLSAACSTACEDQVAEAQVVDTGKPPNAAPAQGQVPSAAHTAGAAAAAQPAEPFISAQRMMPRPGSAPVGGSTSRRLEPLSPDRYKLQLTVTTQVKHKLDLARDLLRHTLPSGDLSTIIERAIDLLLEQTTQRRFAKRKTQPSCPSEPALTNAPAPAPPLINPATPAAATPALTGAERHEPSPTVNEPSACKATAPAPSLASRHIPNQTRRAVLERDGLRCTWQGPDGTRCNSQAWLEYDHIIPRGKGGSNDPRNGRILCRPHNRLAAELAYGQDTITRIITHRRNHRTPPGNPDPSTQ